MDILKEVGQSHDAITVDSSIEPHSEICLVSPSPRLRTVCKQEKYNTFKKLTLIVGPLETTET